MTSPPRGVGTGASAPSCSCAVQRAQESFVADSADNTFDVVILGGGSGGYACALRAAELGMSVVLIEKRQARRHLPAPGLHPDQGAAARRRGRRPHQGERAVRRQGDLRRHRHAARALLQGRRRQPALQGPAGSGQGPRDHLRRGRGPPLLADHGRRRRCPLHRQHDRAGHRLGTPVAARPGDRRRPGHHQRPRARARLRAPLGGDPRRRRDRRRVRQRLEVLRRRRHDRRGPAAPGAPGGREPARSCWSAPSASAASSSRPASGSPASSTPTPG